jgi:prefoldin subunit 5
MNIDQLLSDFDAAVTRAQLANQEELPAWAHRRAGLVAVIAAVAEWKPIETAPDDIKELVKRLRAPEMFLNRDRQEAADALDALVAERDRLTREVDALQQWKDAAKAAEASWDLREVGKLISAPLGAPIRPAIQPAIERLAAENKQLRAERDSLRAALERVRAMATLVLDGAEALDTIEALRAERDRLKGEVERWRAAFNKEKGF